MKVKNFSEYVERDLVRLGQETRSQKKRLEIESLGEKEIIKKSLQSIAGSLEPAQSQGASVVPPTVNDDAHLPSYLQGAKSTKEIKDAVERLIELVFDKGLEAAVRVARRSNPFVEDAFHDALADRLLPELKKRDLLS